VGHFLDVAYQILSEAQEPLSAREITKHALSKNTLKTQGKTPWQTMKSKLATDILLKQEDSLFMRTAQGRFALRNWRRSNSAPEYIADRYTKAILDEEVVVFPATSLRSYIQRFGYLEGKIENGRELMGECFPMLRREAEDDHSVVQLVSVFVVHFEDLYLTYKRTKRLPESRLHGSYSMIFGGHLNPEDMPPLFNIFDPIDGAAFMFRELVEEVVFPPGKRPSISYKGVLYDDSRELSRQHLGIVYDVSLRSPEYAIGERGFLMDPKFESLDAICGRREQFENWSLLILDNKIGSKVEANEKSGWRIPD
jgi:predicted NUDIX family phosphoesterase